MPEIALWEQITFDTTFKLNLITAISQGCSTASIRNVMLL
ncbi:hypothetical protein AVDCRST_MAG92-2354 [uncultured Coleofasciculus sp.]|uniref:Uncharacterized protein n=1 Tax=uncultured Coleofasciculus sp. TaxID=1267456 RepID=A0A6J4IS96_9CYAN|nr:hypothetical protein AVDCRST_MAG92-2354 [uncultured Coleofasciculus sp.]